MVHLSPIITAASGVYKQWRRVQFLIYFQGIFELLPFPVGDTQEFFCPRLQSNVFDAASLF